MAFNGAQHGNTPYDPQPMHRHPPRRIDRACFCY
jgi:hypothetical protein